ncbi:kinase-like protein [Macrolepiota fuliginosa MF-IS2]|uniref:Kinase-like protein n=1 Tax=Macrolepiota fuliginosa MF-IS2 TaxID=1400762 RepID=A0A9P5X2G3_9AGAR|nr:kinase-like protein [Macrolepiota fuliginosa MF-IS2]
MLYPRCYVLKGIRYDSRYEDSGGFCDIVRGRTDDDLELCLKVVRVYQRHETDKIMKIYAREAILWGQLQHPNITPFYGIYYLNEAQERVCLVSPWMENGNIVMYLKSNPDIPRNPLICGIILGLEYLHSENVIHGDLKGLNILVNNSGRACIADFGLSTIWSDKTLGFTVTTGTRVGHTDRWSAPKLLDEDRPSRASDIWAFGCVCYEVLMRLLPFHECSKSVHVIRKLLRGEAPARSRELTTSHPADKINDRMWELINQCWSSKPENRPTCQEVIQELEARAVTPEPLMDQSPHLSQQFRHVMRSGSETTVDLVQLQQVLEEVLEFDGR